LDAAGPVDGPPADLWDWIEATYAGQPHPAAEECRAWWLSHLPPDFVPYGDRTGDATEQRITALLNARLAAERPLPIGLRELPDGGRHDR
jgi:hypothetical protein